MAKQSIEQIKEKFERQRYYSFYQSVKEDDPLIMRILKKIDVFSFIPVPKDMPVSTNRSLIGSLLFFVFFLAFIAFDFVTFITDNAPISQNFYTPLDSKSYQVPDFAINFMEGQTLNNSGSFDNYFTIKYSQQLKDKGFQDKKSIPLQLNGTPSWIDNDTLSFYEFLRVPSQKASMKGLLYSTSNCTYSKIGISMCDINNTPQLCKNFTQISSMAAKGRLFLFIQNNGQQDDVKYQIFNFFLIPQLYRRITISLQVQKTIILPDFFYRFSQMQEEKVTILATSQQTSNTSVNDFQRNLTSLQMLSISFVLAPQILNSRVTYSTLLDHISKWGAFWGVLFGVFALYFLAYNRKKFYKRNPKWENYRAQQQQSFQKSAQQQYTK